MLFTSSVFLLNHNYQDIVRIAGYFLVYDNTIKQIYGKHIGYYMVSDLPNGCKINLRA